MTRRLLFVDDDANVLEGLRHRLHRRRRQWEMTFVGSGEEALAVLAGNPVDVIVTDLRMPRMDGATLLQHVHDQYPHVVRIVLSGHAELETALRAVNVAHQFLAKPSEPGAVESVIERACALQTLISDERIRQIVGRVGQLPSLPHVYTQLKAALARDDASASQITDILKSDMALCAKTLQMVNSAFFRLSRTITEVEEAVVYLGFATILRITLAVEVFQQSRAIRLPAGIDLDGLQRHAMLVASVASGMSDDKKSREDAFVAGLLHDVGGLVLAMGLPDEYMSLIQDAGGRGCTRHEAELAAWGVSHAEVGGYLLGLWGLPYPVIEAVANHHEPWRVETNEQGMLSATYIADALVHEFDNGRREMPHRPLDAEYLARLGIAHRLAEWRELVAREVEAEAAGHAG